MKLPVHISNPGIHTQKCILELSRENKNAMITAALTANLCTGTLKNLIGI